MSSWWTPRRAWEEKAKSLLGAWNSNLFGSPRNNIWCSLHDSSQKFPDWYWPLRFLLFLKHFWKLSAIPDSFQLWGFLDIRADFIPAWLPEPWACDAALGWGGLFTIQGCVSPGKGQCRMGQRPGESSTFLPAMLSYFMNPWISEELTWG